VEAIRPTATSRPGCAAAHQPTRQKAACDSEGGGDGDDPAGFVGRQPTALDEPGRQ
jgi:hypothetical protein